VRNAFGGKWEHTRSLETSNENEAMRREKRLDVEFEERLQAARGARDPEKLAEIVAQATPIEISLSNKWGFPARDDLNDEDYLRAASDANDHLIPRYDLLKAISRALAPLRGDQIEQIRPALLSVIGQQVGRATGSHVVIVDNTHTLNWAYDRWLRKRAGRRDNETIKRTRSHLNEFVDHSKLVLLGDVRRAHLLAWRDRLVDGKKYANNSLNQRVQLVGAVLRTGWADAEMPEQNLRDLLLETDDEKLRVRWSRDEILMALSALKPGSWSAWLYLIGLTTGTRIGEPTAARVGWLNPRTNMIEVDDPRYTKAHKKHVMPLIKCLRGPMLRLAEGRDKDEHLFADAPRPANEKIPISHETSKWFGRHFDRLKIDRVFHELRHTWIEEARHSSVERDVWEVISGHSARTVSDRYGGKKPDVLVEANETVCKFLTADSEIMSAISRLIA
jgi:integrase